MFKKLKSKIDNHFIKLVNSTLDNKLSSINQKIDSTNINLNNVTNNKINDTFGQINVQKRRMDIDVSTYVKAAFVHQKTFPQFKDCCKGKKLVICAAGPSLNKYQPIKDAVHIALNRSILFDKVHFDFLFVGDFAGIKMITNEVINYKNCIKLFAHPFPENFEHWFMSTEGIPESFARECNALRFYMNNHICGGYYNSPFIKDIDIEPLAGHSAIGLCVLQFALYMNPDDLYLVGYDLTGSHFTHHNQSELEKKDEEEHWKNVWEQERENQKKKFVEFGQFTKKFYPNTKIHSINPVGLKGIFDDIIQ